MIRVFRNIRRELAAENKPAKYLRYAVGEILLVVIGILLALQINNWNEVRKDRIQEIKILKEIKSDMLSTKIEVANDLMAHRSILEKSQSLLNHLMNKLPEKDSISILLIGIGADLQVYPKTSGFEALKSKGIHLVTSDSLRKEITNFYQLGMKRLVEIGKKESPELDLLNETAPFVKKYVNPNEDPKSMRWVYSRGDSIFIPRSTIVNYEGMVNDPNLKGAIVSSMINRNDKIHRHEVYVNRIERLIGKIEEELEIIE